MTETLRPSWVVVEYTSNPSTQEAEAGDLKVSSRKKNLQDLPGLQSKSKASLVSERAERVLEMTVDALACTHEMLGSTSRTTERKMGGGGKEEKREGGERAQPV